MSDVKFTSHKAEVMAAFNSAKEVILEEMGIVAERYAKAICPVGTPESTGIPGYKGGTLRRSIGHGYDDNSAWIGTNVEYAPYQELGTIKMQAANGGKGFLKPAIADHTSTYRLIIKTELQKILL